MCHVIVDATEIPCLSFVSRVGIPCFAQVYEVVYIYGQTELKAQLRWKEGVCDKFSPFRLRNHSDDFHTQDEEKRYFP